MSFGDGVKKVGKGLGEAAVEDVRKKYHQPVEYLEKYGDEREYPTEKLMRIYKNATGTKKLVIAKILRDRGCDI